MIELSLFYRLKSPLQSGFPLRRGLINSQNIISLYFSKSVTLSTSKMMYYLSLPLVSNVTERPPTTAVTAGVTLNLAMPN